MDISVQVVWSFALALFLTLVLPILLLLFLCLFKKICPLPMALGLLSFFISQILLRIPLLQLCAGQGWYQALAQSSPLVLGLGLAFTAGLFEESARLGGAALLGPRKPAFPGGPTRPGHRTWKGALSFGLGHAFCELILLAGMTHVNNLLFCVLLGMGEETLSGLLPAGHPDRPVRRSDAPGNRRRPAGTVLRRAVPPVRHLPGVSGCGQAEMAAVPSGHPVPHPV